MLNYIYVFCYIYVTSTGFHFENTQYLYIKATKYKTYNSSKMSPPDKNKGITLCLIPRSIANTHMHIITSQRIQNTHNIHITPKTSHTYTAN